MALPLLILTTPALAVTQCRDGSPIKRITYDGLVNTRTVVVERELIHKAGAAFSHRVWLLEQKRLQDLDLFAEIAVSCIVDTTMSQSVAGVELRYRFTELFQYILAPSGKQTDQDGWMLGVAPSALNLFGYDIRAELQARTTVLHWLKAKEYALYVNSPWAGPVPLSWRAELVQADSKDDLRGFHDRSLNGEFDLEQMGERRWGGLLATGFRKLRHTGGNLDSTLWLSKSSWDWVPHLGAALIWDSRDARLDTRNGIYNELRFTQYGGVLGGPADYMEMLWDLQNTVTVGPGIVRGTMLTRFRPGVIGRYDRLHQGGTNTLRGNYPDSAVWGNSEIITNLEWRQPLVERTPIVLFGVQGFWALQGVVGVDGNWLWTGTRLPGAENYRSAVYAGLHLVLPAIDRLRFEIGGNPYEKTWAISIGLFEKSVTQRWRSR